MASYTCPFCNSSMSLHEGTLRQYHPCFTGPNGIAFTNHIPRETIEVSFYKCPNCEKISIVLKGIGSDVKNILLPVWPTSLAKQFPDYVPQQIRQDYEEAYAIANISPKASATLSRRCLQGMIRDFWQINRNNLAKAIEELESKVSYSQWKAIDSVRKVGNIGAHMENDINLIVDIDPIEAHILLTLIEILVRDWYISRHDDEELYTTIQQISDNKQNQRHPD